MKKILIIRIGAIGDVVHTTNLYRAIKSQNQSIEIHYLTSELIKPLLESDVDISKVITLPDKLNFFSKDTKDFVKILQSEKYDLAINLQPSLKMRLLVFLSRIKKQLIYKKDFRLHAVENFWRTGLKVFPNLLRVEDLKLYLPFDVLNKASNRVKDIRRPIVVLNAGGMFSKRQGRAYPVEKWIELGNKLVNEYGATILLTGAKEDKTFLEPLNNIENSINYIGELTLIDSCALIAQADLMISGDSGPLHIATALGVKSIGLYGSMPANRTGCYCNGINIISKKGCVPCNRRKCKFLRGTNKIYSPCMDDISVEDILKSVKELNFSKIHQIHE